MSPAGPADWFADHVYVGQWLSVVATFTAVLFALFGQHVLAWMAGPRLHIEFKPVEPYLRDTLVYADGTTAERLVGANWCRVKVSNKGRTPARGCVGKVTLVRSGGEIRPDIDPLQLRWAGVPQEHGFTPIHLARDAFEYLAVAVAREDRPGTVHFVTTNADFGFPTWLSRHQEHEVTITVTSDNAKPVRFSFLLPEKAASTPDHGAPERTQSFHIDAPQERVPP